MCVQACRLTVFQNKSFPMHINQWSIISLIWRNSIVTNIDVRRGTALICFDPNNRLENCAGHQYFQPRFRLGLLCNDFFNHKKHRSSFSLWVCFQIFVSLFVCVINVLKFYTIGSKFGDLASNEDFRVKNSRIFHLYMKTLFIMQTECDIPMWYVHVDLVWECVLDLELEKRELQQLEICWLAAQPGVSGSCSSLIVIAV